MERNLHIIVFCAVLFIYLFFCLHIFLFQFLHYLDQQSPAFWAPGTGFMEDSFSMGGGSVGSGW